MFVGVEVWGSQNTWVQGGARCVSAHWIFQGEAGRVGIVCVTSCLHVLCCYEAGRAGSDLEFLMVVEMVVCAGSSS